MIERQGIEFELCGGDAYLFEPPQYFAGLEAAAVEWDRRCTADGWQSWAEGMLSDSVAILRDTEDGPITYTVAEVGGLVELATARAALVEQLERQADGLRRDATLSSWSSKVGVATFTAVARRRLDKLLDAVERFERDTADVRDRAREWDW